MSFGNLVAYRVEVELLSPTILVARAGKVGYTCIRDRLPGQTIKGALLTALYDRGVDPDTLAGLRVTATTGLPIVESKECVFGHPFVMVPKVSLIREGRYGFSLLGDKWLEKMKQVDGRALTLRALLVRELKALARNKIPELKEKLGEDALTFLPALLVFGIGRVFKKERDELLLRFGGYDVGMEVSVAISHVRGASEAAMIFAYEALPAGAKFKATLTDVDGQLTRLLDQHGLLKNGKAELSVRIGRGSSRGFGHAVMRLERVPEEELEEAVDRAREALNNEVVPLLATAPIAELEASDRGLMSAPSPPERLKLPGSWHLATGIGHIGSLELRLVDRAGRTTVVKGYSIRAGLPKLEIKALTEGSLCLYKVGPVSGDAARLLTLAELAGLDELASACLNRVEIAIEDPFPPPEAVVDLIRGGGRS